VMRKVLIESVSFQFLLVNKAFTGMVSRMVDATWGSLVPIPLAVTTVSPMFLSTLVPQIDIRSSRL
jgi:hypothetical protein